jgi:hypothetical protein
MGYHERRREKVAGGAETRTGLPDAAETRERVPAGGARRSACLAVDVHDARPRERVRAVPLDKYRMSVYTGNRVRITRMLDVTSRWKVFFIPFYFRGSPFFFRGVDP